jgi:hypothetical protein
VVLVGDPEQLQAIEAGAAFRALAERHGAAEIGEVRRQREGWQRDATRELATARTVEALDRYERAGMVQAHETREAAREALVDGWAAARVQSPQQSQVILAYTRVDVAALNGLARDRLRQAGELGADQVVQTERGERAMAAGDRLMFLRNERGLGAGPGGRGGAAVKNGTLGTVLGVGADGELLTVRLDGSGGGAGGPAGAGQAGKDAAPVVTFSVREYGHVDHGYAATIHKAQGVTVDRVHVLASEHMDRHAAYVALTRHRDGVALHYGRDEFADGRQLARTLARERAKDTTLDYGNRARPDQGSAQGPQAGSVHDPVAAFAERRGLDPLRPESEIVVRRSRPEAERPTPPLRPVAAQEQVRQAEPERVAAAVPTPLLPAHRDARGRDSLGRGTTPAEIAAVAARDAGVERCRGELEVWLDRAYRDPAAARAQLDALALSEGGSRSVEHFLRQQEGGPEVLGELRGKTGWFASAAEKAERAAAVRCAGSVGGGLVRLQDAEERAGQRYVREVEVQRVRDQVEVPGLSPAAWAAVRAVEQAGEAADRTVGAKPNKAEWEVLLARQGPLVAEAWKREVVGRPGVEAELKAVAEAAGRRLGEDGLRDLVRSARSVQTIQDEPVQRQGLAGIGRVAAAAGEGWKAHAAQQQRVREEQRLKAVQQEPARDVQREQPGQRQGPRMGM